MNPFTQHDHVTPGSRQGAALILIMVVVTTLTVMAVSMASVTTANLIQQRYRARQVNVQIASDEAVNETMFWLSNNASALSTLPAHPEVVLGAYNVTTGRYDAATVYSQITTLSPSQMIDSSSTSMFPATLAVSATAISEPGWSVNQRNGCAVSAKVVCLVATSAGHVFPDGNERYLIIATAGSGNASTDAENYQRRRVMTVISLSATHPFTDTMYSISSYDVGGSAGTDSWTGPPSTYNPANAGNAALGYDSGNIASGGTVTTSGSANVDGTITSNVKVALPTFTYSPPASATTLAAISAATTIAGPGVGSTATYRTSSMTAPLVISGDGTVNLFVDGPISTNSITFAAGSTAKLLIQQNNYSSALGSTSWSLNGGAIIGAVSKSGGLYTADPTRLEYITGFTGSLTLNGNGMFAGVIYAPYATMNMNGTFQFFGAMLADSFGGKVNGTFNFHYDTALSSLSLPVSPQLSAVAWDDYTVSATQP